MGVGEAAAWEAGAGDGTTAEGGGLMAVAGVGWAVVVGEAAASGPAAAAARSGLHTL